MPQVQVHDAKLKMSPDSDEELEVKVIEARSVDGMTTQMILPLDAAADLGNALLGKGEKPSALVVAQPGDVPPVPPENNAGA